jgi:hypothetical protein
LPLKIAMASAVLPSPASRRRRRPRADEDARHLDVALACGKHQRRQPAAGEAPRFAAVRLATRRAPLEAAPVAAGHVVRTRVDVGASGDEQRAASAVPFRGRPHQRRGATPRLSCVDVGAGLHEHTKRVGLAVRAAIISAVSPAGVNGALASAPALSSRSSIGALPLVAASWSGVTPSRVRAVTRAPAADQHVRHRHVVALDRPVKGGAAVHPRGVDVRLTGKSRAHRARRPRAWPRRPRRPSPRKQGHAANSRTAISGRRATRHFVTLSSTGAVS